MKNTKKQSKNNRIFIIFISAFLAFAVILASVLGIISAVEASGAIISYEGVRFKAGVVNYLSSYYKYNYLKVLTNTVKHASDNELFWAEDSGDGKSYGEQLSESCEEYLKELIVSVYLYDSYARLSGDERDKISASCREVLSYKAGGSVSEFNNIASEYGFEYSDFEKATEILYKSYMAKTAIYGAGGVNLKNYPQLCNEYLSSRYSYVRLLFIRTETRFALDENGNRLKDSDGNDLTVSLTDGEKAERLAAIANLSAAIEGKKNGSDMQISPEMFSLYQKNYGEGDSQKDESGYYFAPDASYTQEFKTAYPTVVDMALSMGVYEYEKVQTDEGVCFIYRMPAEDGAYAADSDGFFSDFYSDCSDFSYSESLATLADSVKISEKYERQNIITIPYNNDLIAYIGG